MIGLIYRASEFSPRDNVQKDAVILEAVGNQLQQRKQEVVYFKEEDLDEAARQMLSSCSICLSMGRRDKTLSFLQSLKQRGILVLNAPNAVRVTAQSRSTTLELLQVNGLPVVPFWSYEPSEDCLFQCEPELQALLPGWIKAMHLRGVSEGDVRRVNTPLEADSAVLQFAMNGYNDLIITRHEEGRLQKLYVVGDQIVNLPEDESVAFAELARNIRRTLNLDVWGVDLILTEHGPIIIDVNDFPSFNACRDVAAPLIADYVMQAAEL